MTKWLALTVTIGSMCTVASAADVWARTQRTLLDEQLIVAAEREPAARVEALLRAGAKPNGLDPRAEVEKTALGQAVWRGDARIVRILLTAGADPNTPIGGGTALILAARLCHAEIVKLLLASGADVNARFGPNALIWALTTLERVGSRTDTALTLVEAGSEVNEIVDRRTPLEHAVNAGEFSVARAMIAKGASVEAAIKLAQARGDRHIVEWLKKATAAGDAPVGASVAEGVDLPALETLVRRLEAMTNGETPDLVPSDDDVERMGRDIAAYLKSNRSDAEGLVLWARLARVRPEAVSVPPGRADREIASALNRAVKLAPTSAVAHYWRGQAYADEQSKAADGQGSRYRSLDRAVESFRKAVALAPLA